MRRQTRVRSYIRSRHGLSDHGGQVSEHARGYEAADLSAAIKNIKERPMLWSYRDWGTPGAFRQAYEDCGDDWECQGRVRVLLRRVEDGRYHAAMEKLHSFLCSLDKDEAVLFFSRYPGLKATVNEYAVIEELNYFD